MVQMACDADLRAPGGPDPTPCGAASLLGRCVNGDETVLGHCPMCNTCM